MFYISINSNKVLPAKLFKKVGDGIVICTIKLDGIESHKPFKVITKIGKLVYVRPYDVSEKVKEWKEEFINEKGIHTTTNK